MINNETLMDNILPNMISTSYEIAEALGKAEISNGLQNMKFTTNHEIDRLKSLHKKNKNIRPEEILIALEEQTNLASLIGNARIRLDALQLIHKE